MLIDLHTHTTKHSNCSKMTAEELAEAAIGAGLDGIALTEHNSLWDADEIDKLRMKFPQINIFNAIEVSIEEKEHILVYGVLIPGAFYQNMPLKELEAVVKAENGIMVLAHPYRYKDEVSNGIFSCGIEGLEVASTNVLAYMKEGMNYIKSKINPIEVMGSDAHSIDSVGVFATDFKMDIKDELDLVKAIRSKDFTHYKNVKALNERNENIDKKILIAKNLIEKGLTDSEVKNESGRAVNISFSYAVRNGKDVHYIV